MSGISFLNQWFKGKSTGNHGVFPSQYGVFHGFPVDLSQQIHGFHSDIETHPLLDQHRWTVGPCPGPRNVTAAASSAIRKPLGTTKTERHHKNEQRKVYVFFLVFIPPLFII